MFTLAKIILTVRIDEVFSLKQKRSILKKIKTHVLNRYNACIAESHNQDSLRYVGITIGILSHQKSSLQSLVEKINEQIEIISEGFVEEEKIEIL